MPCNDGGIPFPPTREDILNTKTGAMLCAIVHVLIDQSGTEKEFFAWLDSSIDWKEAGISLVDIKDWWRYHKARDRERKENEQLAKKQKDQYQKTIASLTPKQRKVLGL